MSHPSHSAVKYVIRIEQCDIAFRPAVNPAKEITDPNDAKPEEWDEREK